MKQQLLLSDCALRFMLCTDTWTFVEQRFALQVIGLDECLQRVNAMVEEAKKAAGIDINKPLASLVSLQPLSMVSLITLQWLF